MKGVAAVQAAEYVKKKHPLAVQAMNEELVGRPGIISRDPAWHKFNFMGFKLIPNADTKDKTIKLNPLVFKGFGLDCDGDQCNINIPATISAQKEILSKMLPSQNLFSPKTLSPILIPSNESALGLYELSAINNHNTPKKFKTELDAVKAYQHGDIAAADNVEIG
jgi:DNA-directed RNA polymerase beta' subunit